MKEIFFINGMPRSGSTLLCNILAQNPDFHVTPTSGLSELIRATHQFWKTNAIIKASETPEKQLQIIRDMFQSYHADTNRPVVFNKSRGWVSLIELIENALGKPVKILSTTRKITCILASLEKLYRKELTLINSPLDISNLGSTIEMRLSSWTSQDGLVGSAFNTLKDAVLRGHRKKILFVDFEKLTSEPTATLKTIYYFLEKDYFPHDFDNIKQYTKENDAEHGFTDLHTIRPEIKPVRDDSKEILGHMWEQFKDFHYNF